MISAVNQLRAAPVTAPKTLSLSRGAFFVERDRGTAFVCKWRLLVICFASALPQSCSRRNVIVHHRSVARDCLSLSRCRAWFYKQSFYIVYKILEFVTFLNQFEQLIWSKYSVKKLTKKTIEWGYLQKIVQALKNWSFLMCFPKT